LPITPKFLLAPDAAGEPLVRRELFREDRIKLTVSSRLTVVHPKEPFSQIGAVLIDE
jgi:hypothetical protein